MEIGCRCRNSPYFCSQKLRPNFQTRTLNFYILGSAALQATSSRRLLAPQSTHGKRGARLRSYVLGGALCSVRERGRNCENSYQRRRPVADSVLLSGCHHHLCSGQLITTCRSGRSELSFRGKLVLIWWLLLFLLQLTKSLQEDK